NCQKRNGLRRRNWQTASKSESDLISVPSRSTHKGHVELSCSAGTGFGNKISSSKPQRQAGRGKQLIQKRRGSTGCGKTHRTCFNIPPRVRARLLACPERSRRVPQCRNTNVAFKGCGKTHRTCFNIPPRVRARL